MNRRTYFVLVEKILISAFFLCFFQFSEPTVQAQISEVLSRDFKIQPQVRYDYVKDIWFSKDGDVALTLGAASIYGRYPVLTLWDLDNGRILWREEVFDGGIWVKFFGFLSNDQPVIGTSTLSGNNPTVVHVLDVLTGVRTGKWELGRQAEIELSDDGRSVLEKGESGEVVRSISAVDQRALTPDRVNLDLEHRPGWLPLFDSEDGKWTDNLPLGWKSEGKRRIISDDGAQRLEFHDSGTVIFNGQEVSQTGKKDILLGPFVGKGVNIACAEDFHYGDSIIYDLIRGSQMLLKDLPGPPQFFTSPDGRVFLATQWAQNRTSDETGDQFFGELIFGGGKVNAKPWPNTALIHDRTLSNVIGNRYLILGYMSSDQSDSEVHTVHCFDLHELKLLWSRPHNHSFSPQALYSNGKDLVLHNTRDDPSTLRDEGLRVVTDIQTGIQRLVSPGFNWERMKLLRGSYGEIQANALDDAGLNLEISQEPPYSWILYSSDGYFSASADGGKIVSVTNGLKSYRIDQFAADRNRPDVLMKRLGLVDPSYISLVEEQVKKRLDRMGASNFVSGDPPTGEIISHQRTNESEIKLEFSCRAGESDLASFQLYVNGTPLFAASGREVNGRFDSREENITLASGENLIELSYTDKLGRESARESLSVFKGSEDERSLYFLGIAASDYDDPLFKDLSFTDDDVEDVSSVLEELRGFRAIHKFVLVDEEVTDSKLDEARGWLSGARPEDQVIILISGHGVSTNGEYFFVRSSARASDLGGTSIPFLRFEEMLMESPARSKLFLIDTCESGEGPGGTDQASIIKKEFVEAEEGLIGRNAFPIRKVTQRAKLSSEFLLSDLRRRTGAVVISSSQWNQLSYEREEWKNGAFTEAFLEALSSGAADANGDFLVNKLELQRYLQMRVANLTGDIQHPAVDRDNPLQEFNFALSEPDESVYTGWIPVSKGDLEVTEASPAYIWGSGDVRLDGARVWAGEEILRVTYADDSWTVFMGTFLDGRMDGEIEVIDSDGKRQLEIWIEGDLAGIVTDSIIPLAVPGGRVGYMRNGFTSSWTDYWMWHEPWIWNNAPRSEDHADWSGDQDELGLASGEGTLTWYKISENDDERIFSVSYEGTMVRGKFEGVTAFQDSDGSVGQRIWKEGRKVK